MNGFLKKALRRPPLTGGRALLFAIAALTVPTLVHLAVNGSGTGLAFIVYFPSVILAALLMRSWQSAVFALVCAATGDWVFLEKSFNLTASANDLFGIPIFLIASALVIAAVGAMRGLIEDVVSPHLSSGKVIFSEEKEQAWAHWLSDRPSVRLGPHAQVAEMMEDYLAQVELGRRLTRQDRES